MLLHLTMILPLLLLQSLLNELIKASLIHHLILNANLESILPMPIAKFHSHQWSLNHPLSLQNLRVFTLIIMCRGRFLQFILILNHCCCFLEQVHFAYFLLMSN